MAEKKVKNTTKKKDEVSLPLMKHGKTFAEAFPEMESVRVEVEEKGNGITPANRIRTLAQTEFGEHIYCQNSWCQKGGFSIGEVLKDMGDKRLTERVLIKTCIGKETGRGGGRVYRPCAHIFNLKVQIVYKK